MTTGILSCLVNRPRPLLGKSFAITRGETAAQGQPDGFKYANVDSAERIYVDDTLGVYFMDIHEGMNRALLTEDARHRCHLIGAIATIVMACFASVARAAKVIARPLADAVEAGRIG